MPGLYSFIYGCYHDCGEPIKQKLL
jgi:hypothetical protein